MNKVKAKKSPFKPTADESAVETIVIYTSFYIYELRQIGNVGAHEICPIDEQPEEGFTNEEKAEAYLVDLLESDKYPFVRGHRFAIMPIYSKNE